MGGFVEGDGRGWGEEEAAGFFLFDDHFTEHDAGLVVGFFCLLVFLVGKCGRKHSIAGLLRWGDGALISAELRNSVTPNQGS